MNRKNSQFIFCVKCKGTLTLDVFDETSEINEGFFLCNNCHLQFPIISKIPIFVENLSQFLANRSSLGGLLFELSLTKVMKEFIKNTISKIKKSENFKKSEHSENSNKERVSNQPEFSNVPELDLESALKYKIIKNKAFAKSKPWLNNDLKKNWSIEKKYKNYWEAKII